MSAGANTSPAKIAGNLALLPLHGNGESMKIGPHSVPNTADGIHVFQSFDGYVPYKDAKSHGTRYNMVWGSSIPSDWSVGNPAILNMWYLPITTDGDKRNTLAWWQAFHPEWILYRCDEVTPAWSQGLPAVPLDISNPDAVAWQIQTYANKAEDLGYSGIAADLVGFTNNDRGCGVWVAGQWVAKFSGQQDDPAWAQSVQSWAAYAHSYLHGLARPLILAANHIPHGAPGDPSEKALIGNLDIDDDEAGFSTYGNGPVSDSVFNTVITWMGYAQSIGHAFFVVDKWRTPTVTQAQLDWSIATYLMGKRNGASLDVVGGAGYGYEYWYPQYDAAIGHACGRMYVDQSVYFRRYSGGLSIVNTSSSKSFTVNLPQPTYTSIDGGTVQSPAVVGPSTGLVLLAQVPGC